MALCALILAIVSLVWQVASWIFSRRERRRTVIHPLLSISRVQHPVERVVAHLRVVNGSEHGVTVDQVSIHGKDAAGDDAVQFLGAEWRQQNIAARNGHSDATPLTSDFLDWSKPVVAQVLLANNLWFNSEAALAPPPLALKGDA